jgi:hypothetical protein
MFTKIAQPIPSSTRNRVAKVFWSRNAMIHSVLLPISADMDSEHAMHHPILILCRMSDLMMLQDLEDTTGSWELYGQEDEKRYPSLQAEFFNRAAGPLTRRESLLAFTFVGARHLLLQRNSM